jgi:glycine cleavage system H protein
MNDNPTKLRYSKSHEWVREEGDDIYTVGITDHAQSMLGDIVFVELPELEAEISAGDEVAVIESVKTAADIYSPVSGQVVAVNEALTVTPEIVNSDVYGEGWLFRIKVKDTQQLTTLLDANDYENSIEGSS